MVLEAKVKVKSLSRIQLFATAWIAAYQALPSVGFSRQEDWGGLLFPSPGDLLTQGSNSGLPHCRQTLLLPEPPEKALEAKVSANLTHKHVGKNSETSFAELDPVVKETLLKLHALFFLHSFLLILSSVLWF